VSGDVCEDEVPGWTLKSKSTYYPDHGHHGDLPLPGKFTMVEPGIEPGTSWLVVRNLDHQTTRLVLILFAVVLITFLGSCCYQLFLELLVTLVWIIEWPFLTMKPDCIVLRTSLMGNSFEIPKI
jgi:hypothetical protein